MRAIFLSSAAKSGTALQKIAQVAVVAVCTLAFGLNAAAVLVTLTTDRYVGSRDFVTYWAAGQQLVHGANPYDSHAVLPVERRAGFPPAFPAMVMRNAPPALIAVLPLGLLPVRFASLFWGALLTAALWLSIRITAELFGGKGSQLTLLACAFAPTLSCLIAGQTSIFALLGLVLFLKFHARRPFWAGCALWLSALKPQIFVLFGIVLMLWALRNRKFRVLGGLLVTLGLTSACAMILDPHIWSDYFRMIRGENIPNLMIPCIGTLLRLVVGAEKSWVQVLPLILGAVWAVLYFLRNRHSWDWLEHGGPLMLTSVFVAPYSWFMDQSALLPAIMKEVYGGASGLTIAVVALLSAVVEFANLRGVPLGNMALYSWSAAWWLFWYWWVLLTRKQSRRLPAAECETYPSTQIV